MRAAQRLLWSVLALIALAGSLSTAAHAQAKPKNKHYAVSSGRAVSITRTVLVERGYTVVRVERVGATQVVYYRRGNMGRGKGKGRLEKMVIRQVRDRVVFEEAEPSVLVDIDLRLKL
jgi:hypothetical protein